MSPVLCKWVLAVAFQRVKRSGNDCASSQGYSVQGTCAPNHHANCLVRGSGAEFVIMNVDELAFNCRVCTSKQCEIGNAGSYKAISIESS